VLGKLRSDADRVIRSRAKSVGAPVRAWGEHFLSFGEVPKDATEGESALVLSMPGRVARLNATLAIECIRALGVYDGEAIDSAAAHALSRCRLPARIEVLEKDPSVIIDAAHTAQSAQALSEALVELAPGGFDLLLSVSNDKNLEEILNPLLPRVRRVWATCADPTRSLDATILAERVNGKALSMGLSIEVESEPDPVRATTRARRALAAEAVLCAAGSVYLAGIARRVLTGSG